MHINNYKTIILDCDGVIFDSNNLKIDAFRDALNEFDVVIVDAFIKYFKNNFGTSRYHLLRVFIEVFLKQDFDEKVYRDMLARYGQNCVILYDKSELTKYLLKFLNKYSDKNIFVASGSDQEELRVVFKNRNLDKYFVGIFGSPTKKSELVKNIVSKNKNTVMIGDAKSDMLSAQNNKIDFIFMSEYSTNSDMKKDSSLNSIRNLGDLT
jgi:HAD superfamily hydrolase (TIGR01549 family)